MEQETSRIDQLEKSIINALSGAFATNAIGQSCICERVTGQLTVTPITPEDSDASNIDQWTEVKGTSKATIKISQDITEADIPIDFTVLTENCKVISVKSVLAQTSTVVSTN